MSKQTATQYLIQEIKNDSLVQAKSTEEWNEVFIKALLMEREQIEEAYGDGLNAHRVDFCNRNEYYQKTYGGQDE
jgi:hypothetical protein